MTCRHSCQAVRLMVLLTRVPKKGGGARKKFTVQSEAWMHQQIGLEVQERVSAELHLMVDCCKCSVKPLKDGAGRLQLCREMGNLVSEDF